MASRIIHTKYKYDNTEHPFCIVVNDTVADSIRDDSFVNYVDSDLTRDEAELLLKTYVGDITDFGFPITSYNVLNNPKTLDFLKLFFPNAYEVLGVDPALTNTDYCDFNGKLSDSRTSNKDVRLFQKSSNNTCLAGSTSINYVHNGYQNTYDVTITYYVPIFKEVEVPNDVITIGDSGYFSWVQLSIGGKYSDSSLELIGNKFSFSAQKLRSTINNYIKYYNGSIIPVDPIPPTPTPSDDPYSQGGYSGGGGGPAPTGGTGTTGNGGLHDDSSDAIPTPNTPSDIAISSGLFTAYNPSAGQLATFANKLWNMDINTINDVFRILFGGDAFNAIIGLHLLPVAPSVGSSQHIMLGNWDSEATAPVINSQYKQVNFGSVLLPEYWGNCIDYSPYTKIQLALPYIGIVDVDADDVIGSTNTLTYNIDVLSGAICAMLHVQKFNLQSVIYQWAGSCAVSLPTTGSNYNSIMGAIAGVAAAGMGFAAMATGPVGAALPAAALAAGGGAFGAGSAASIMGSMKGKVQKSGAFGANSGALGIMTPYFILTRPVQSVPSTWQADKGYPANISALLSTVTGYTEVSEINLVGISGTEEEKNEIISLLKKGVIF